MNPDQEEEALDYGEEIAAIISPVLVGNDDNGDDILNEDGKEEMVIKKERKPFVGAKFIDLYSTMGQERICAQSVEKKLRSTWVKWEEYWKESKFSGEPWINKLGLQLYHGRSDINNPKDYDHARVDGFLQWISDKGYGKSVVKDAKTFLNTHLKCEHFTRLSEAGSYGAWVSISVGESMAVKSSVKTINQRVAKDAMENCKDLLHELDQLLAPDKTREILLSIFNPKSGGRVSKLDPVNGLIFCCMFTGLSQTSRRGEEMYSQKMVQRTTTLLREIGPFSTPASVVVTNKAKHNQEGWLEYTTMLPHMDPLRDATAWHGCLLLWRIHVSNEVFPQFIGNTDYQSIFSVYSYPSAKDPKKPILPKKCGDIFSCFYGDCDAVCAKLVHQPRLQAIQEMDRVGIHEALWTRMSGHKGKDVKVHTRSYAHNPPSTCLVQRAGGDPNDLKGFHPVHFLPTLQEQQWLSEMVNSLIPSIVQQHNQACEEYTATKSSQDRKNKRLTTIKGLLGSAKHDVEHFIMMMASPLVHPETYAGPQQHPKFVGNVSH